MTAYVLITRNNDGGYRVQLRDHLHAQRPLMQSAREPTPSKAHKAAERLFGVLDWRGGVEMGMETYVESVAVIMTAQGEW